MMNFNDWWHDVQSIFQAIGYCTAAWDEVFFKETYYDNGYLPCDTYEAEIEYLMEDK